MSMCRVGRIGSRFGRTSVFGRSWGRKMIITMSMCRGLLSSMLSSPLFVRSLFSGLFRSDRRGGVQVFQQEVVLQALPTVLVKLPFQLVVVVGVVVVVVAVSSAKDSSSGFFSCSGMGLQLFMIKALSRRRGALSGLFTSTYLDARRRSAVLQHHLFRDTLWQVPDDDRRGESRVGRGRRRHR